MDNDFGIKSFYLGGYEDAVDIEQSTDGGFYIGGGDSRTGLTRLDAAGSKVWGKPYNDIPFTWVEDIALDGQDNVYVSMVDYGAWAARVQKYDSEGNFVKSYATTPTDRSFISGVAVNKGLHRVYAVFNHYDGAAGKYVLSLKMFDEDLNVMASASYGAPSTVWAGSGINLDKAGNVYVSGTQVKTAATPARHIGLKYDVDLNLVWEVDAPFVLQQGWTTSEAVPDGGMYLACFEEGDTYDRLINISSDGVKMWETPISEDYGYYKGVDQAGNFYGSRFLKEDAWTWTPTISKLGYDDGDIKWNLAEPHAYKIDDIHVDAQLRVYTVGDLLEPQGDANYYIARYVHGEAPKNYISKSAPPEPHLVNAGAYSAPLVSLVKDPGGNPVSNVNLSFSISRYPPGATGQQLTKNSEITDAAGLADVSLRLGNLPAEYDVTAECQSCAPESNSVTFTCCGKLPNDHFSQSGQTWSPICYANNNCQLNPNATIGWRGCALTSMATLINYYNANVYSGIPRTDPGDLNTYLRGLPGGYNGRNDVNFDAIYRYSSGRTSFVGRYDVDDPYSRESLLDMADGLIRSGIPLILRISGHFVLAIGKCGDSFVVADPAGGIERLYNPDNTNDREFEGLRVFGS